VLIVIGALAALGSLVIAWLNARFLAHRIERLAGASATVDQRLTGPSQQGHEGEAGGALRGMVSAVAPNRPGRLPDEIDAIQQTLNRLSTAVASDRADWQRHLAERVRDHARLLAAVTDEAKGQLDDVRLPLHILLDNRFGELNENQEEMLGAARAAAEAIEADLTSLRRIAELDLGEREMRLERMRPSDLIEGITPVLGAAAEGRDGRLVIDIAPLLPAVLADRVQLREALTTLLKAPIVDIAAGTALSLTMNAASEDAVQASERAPRIVLELKGGTQPKRTIHSALASRIVAAHGGTVEKGEDVLRITLPTEHAQSI
jgi:signal transduction histidine kinase